MGESCLPPTAPMCWRRKPWQSASPCWWRNLSVVKTQTICERKHRTIFLSIYELKKVSTLSTLLFPSQVLGQNRYILLRFSPLPKKKNPRISIFIWNNKKNSARVRKNSLRHISSWFARGTAASTFLLFSYVFFGFILLGLLSRVFLFLHKRCLMSLWKSFSLMEDTSFYSWILSRVMAQLYWI